MWSEEQSAALTKLWNEGKSGGEIALILGVTRCAAIGRIHRLRDRGAEVKEHVREPGKRQRRTAPRVQGRPKERIIRLVKPSKPIPLADTLEGSVPLDERTGCKWPVTAGPPHRFCNRDTLEGAPYCAGHSVRAYQPRSTLRTQNRELPTCG